MKHIALIIYPLLLLAVWNTAEAQSVPPAESEKTAILSVINHQVDGWNNGNIEEFMQGYAKSDSLRFASGGTVTFGWKNMLSRYQRRYSTRDSMGTLVFSGISVDLLSSGSAIAFGAWKLKREKDQPWGLFTLLFKKINGEWRIVHDHTSSGN
ncbi:MAG: YybH family protein [Bacteroidota bacterium]